MNVFAIVAAVIFGLDLLGVELGSVDMTTLGLFFLALAIAWGLVLPLGRRA